MAVSLVSRRVFLADLGRGAFAVAVLGVAGCGPGGSLASRPPGASASPSSGSSVPSGGSGDPGSAAPASSGTGSTDPGGAVTWTRVNLGFVSAYLLVRAGEAAVVDTGVAGSEDEIAAALTGIGLDWSAVGHVILTHKH
ncbi:MAG TPA: MBL fold metallo-hydrolase, partial [Candidatus Limnocylindrales bacterium]|nr:MBL fold metallo-hydrolase [Candidatus Limnocylindrales bacterium]